MKQPKSDKECAEMIYNHYRKYFLGCLYPDWKSLTEWEQRKYYEMFYSLRRASIRNSEARKAQKQFKNILNGKELNECYKKIFCPYYDLKYLEEDL